MPVMKPADLAILQTELTSDPEGIGYSAMGELTAANAMNAASAPVQRQPVPLPDILTWLIENDKYSAILNSAISATHTSTQRFQRVAGNPNIPALDPDDADAAKLFTDLRDDGYLTTPDLVTIKALAESVNTGPSRAESLGLVWVYPENIEQARAI